MFISQPFEELQGLNLEFMLVPNKSITRTHFGTTVAILDIFQRICVSCLKSYRANIWNLSLLVPNVILRTTVIMFNFFNDRWIKEFKVS